MKSVVIICVCHHINYFVILVCKVCDVYCHERTTRNKSILPYIFRFHSLVIPFSVVLHQIILKSKTGSLIILNVNHCLYTPVLTFVLIVKYGQCIFAFHNCVLSTFIIFVFSNNSSKYSCHTNGSDAHGGVRPSIVALSCKLLVNLKH